MTSVDLKISWRSSNHAVCGMFESGVAIKEPETDSISLDKSDSMSVRLKLRSLLGEDAIDGVVLSDWSVVGDAEDEDAIGLLFDDVLFVSLQTAEADEDWLDSKVLLWLVERATEGISEAL